MLQLISEVLAGRRLACGRVTARSASPIVLTSAEGRDRPARKNRKWGRRLACSVGPILLLSVLGWVGHCFLGWQHATGAMSAPNRETQLFHQLAEQRLRQTMQEVSDNPEQGHELWDRYLELFSDTPSEGAARAEKRNLPKKRRAVSEKQKPRPFR